MLLSQDCKEYSWKMQALKKRLQNNDFSFISGVFVSQEIKKKKNPFLNICS